MPHVSLDEVGNIAAIFGGAQEYSIEIPDDDPRIFAFNNRFNPVQMEIDKLERDSMMNRGVRELSLRLMEQQAAAIAQAQGTTQEAVLATVPAYVKFKALDEQITALRAQI